MFCANHPDVQAMASCQVCNKPLCPVCIYFHAGMVYCRDHNPETGAGTVAFEQARSGADDETHSFADPATSNDGAPPAIAGAPAAPPLPPPMPLQVWTPPPAPHWASNPRLTPLPMELRPGWSEEPLAPIPGNADALGTAGVIIGAIALVSSLCCGVGAPVGLALGVLSSGLAAGALVGAKRARNPQQARTMGGIGLAIAVIAILGGLCMSALLLGVSFNSLFNN